MRRPAQKRTARPVAGAPQEVSRRLRLLAPTVAEADSDFGHDVAAGLTAHPRRLHCRYFYDEQGSLLFEQICALPEYYLTRAEAEILERHAAEMAALVPAQGSLVELGSGSSVKTRLLIEALLQRHGRLHYAAVDISRSMLESSAHALLTDYPALEMTAVAAEYQAGLALLLQGGQMTPDGPRLILWLGSNVGNFHRDEAAAFLAGLRASLRADDRLLLGIDLRKERAVLEPAYDDAQGVTARFNLNLLARINRELGGDFALDGFAHRAVYDEVLGRVEIHIVSTRAQRVTVRGLGLELEFAAGEAIHTENSYKYSPDEIAALAKAAGLRIERQWFDGARRFSENLLAPV
ncbi:MAG TPA: L-histidine N(alpha)-methyltransferase [Polyangia bacterium]|nr:L-histidine N(alpha)-methyltransferase [Polyangia bacterium]